MKNLKIDNITHLLIGVILCIVSLLILLFSIKVAIIVASIGIITMAIAVYKERKAYIKAKNSV